MWAGTDGRAESSLILRLEHKKNKKANSSSGKGRKYAPLQERLTGSGVAALTLSFDEIAALVGNLPPSAAKHREWWANHAGNSQANGWMPAGYRAEPDLALRHVAFRRAG